MSPYSNGTGAANGANGQHAAQDFPIAIIGMACRFPGEAENTEKLWQLLENGRCTTEEFPKNKLNIDAHFHPDPAHGGSTSVRGGHFVKDNGASFDAPFFSLTKTEVMSMDPQQRITMENVYEALENAGVTMDQVIGSETSCYVGAFTSDYDHMLNMDPEMLQKYLPTGNSKSILSNRVSWFYDLKGGSLTVDTACSSSLVAMHLGCQNLREGQSDMSIISGVNLIERPELMARMSNIGFLSPDSICYSFDHRANGYTRSEGVGTIIIKPLDKAIRDGNTIRAVIRGTGINQDGRTPGMTVPSKDAQERLIRQVYAQNGLDLAQTHFVEAHGTGTAAGDPIEAGAIANSYTERKTDIPLHIGAIKSNIGHTEGASGVAGIIKTVEVLEKGIIPPNINFEKVNPKILPEKWNVTFPVKNVPFPGEGVRRGSINSFGFGGTNAHVVIDDAYSYLQSHNLKAVHQSVAKPPTQKEIDSRLSETGTLSGVNAGVANGHANGATENGHAASPAASKKVFIFSAYDEGGIKRSAESLKEYFSTLSPPDESRYIDNLAYTLAKKRTLFSWKGYGVAGSLAELADRLGEVGRTAIHSRKKDAVNLGFVFTGQGAQWHAMGRELMAYPSYKRSVEEASAYLDSIGAPWHVVEELAKDAESSQVNHPAMSQTACTVLQVALVDLMAEWKILPTRVIGHSSGEIAAAYAAGGLDKESAWKAAYYRGYVAAKLINNKGAMMAVGVSPDELQPYMDKVKSDAQGELVMACFNSPRNVTVSGDDAMVEKLREMLDADGLFARKLKVQNAYHSGHMKLVAEEYAKLMGTLNVGKLPKGARRVTMFSTVQGKQVGASDLADPQYWVANLVSPVRFTEALTQMVSPSQGKSKLRTERGIEIPVQHLVEVGPHPALQSAAKEITAQDPATSNIAYSFMVKRNTSAFDTTLAAAGALFCNGHNVDLNAVNFASLYDDGQTVAQPFMLTDLPPYKFNNKEEYWPESRLSKNYRFRKAPRHDLLGAPVNDWNVAEPKWRQIIRTAEIPWVKDHKVTGSIVYPGVGYIVMAIEAIRQLERDNADAIKGFRLKDISIKTALQIPEGELGIEVVVALPVQTESAVGSSSVWREFKVQSYNSNTDDWTEHARGLVTLEHDTSTGPIDDGREAAEEARLYKEQLEQGEKTCQTPVDMAQQYTELEIIGLSFGPTFRNLRDVTMGDGTGAAMGVVKVADIASTMPRKFMASHVIHPSTMDSMLHTFLAAVQDAFSEDRLNEPMVPTFISEVYVSADIPNEVGHAFRTHATAGKIGHKKIEASITAWDTDDYKVKAVIKGLQATSLGSNATVNPERCLNYRIKWAPDIDLLENKQCEDYIRSIMGPPPFEYDEAVSIGIDMNLTAVAWVHEAVKAVPSLPEDTPDHLVKYHRWLKHQDELYQKGEILHQQSNWKSILDDDAARKKHLKFAFDTYGAETALMERIGANLPGILTGKVDALNLMFGQGDDLLDAYYRELRGTDRVHESMRQYLDTFSHKRVNLKVLEIGAGTGGTSVPVLETLCPVKETEGREESRISLYTYTDLSPGFFEKAKAKFKNWKHIMEFKKLDVEKDPLDQGYEEGTYDIVVAANVIHATVDLENTLKNVRKLLRPGGKFLLHEAIQGNFLCGSLCFGTLPGWWLSKEEIRNMGPLLTEPQWNDMFQKSGFTGTDNVFKDYLPMEIHAQSLLVGTNPESIPKEALPPKTYILSTPESQKFVDPIKSALQSLGVREVSTTSLEDIANVNLAEATVVMTNELATAALANLTEANYPKMKHMLLTCQGLLWLTKDAFANPEVALIQGLLRSIRWERDLDDSNLITLIIEDIDQPMEQTVSEITKVFKYQFMRPNDQRNAEYRSSNGMITINRLVGVPTVDDYMTSRIERPVAHMRPFGEDPERALKLVTDAPGLLNKLQFVDDPLYPQPLGEVDVEVEIKATGLNFRDIMSAMGEVRGDVFGAEGAGIVSRVGSKVKKCKPGDRVMLLATYNGCFQTYSRTIESAVAIMPENLSYEVAAGMPVIFGTVYYCLFDIARLQKGESILIHAAAGGVGQAAIMLAQKTGAEIYATVSSPEKRAILEDTYGIPRDHIFSSRDLSFSKGIMRMTKGKGVDVILNSLAGEALRRSWDCIACFGRFLEIGKRDIYSNGKLDMYPFRKSVMFASCDLETVVALDPAVTSRLVDITMDLWKEGSIRETTPFTTYNLGQLESSFRLLQSGKHIGKVVLTHNKDDLVPTIPKTMPPYYFNPNATYILSGGLGGIGRSTAQWMATRGAKNIVFLSRSGDSTAPAKELLGELREKGVKAEALVCDVGNKDQLESCIEKIRSSYPPIKGLVQGAMHLRDSAFENMTYDKYSGCLNPKVSGSWNLHQALPRDMEFFIMLSSMCGLVGNRGQANYAAGNTYQDALAHYRLNKGLPAATIDLGSILNVGWMAENTETVNPFAYANDGIRIEEVIALTEYYMDQRNPMQTHELAQVCIGMATSNSFKRKGLPEPTFLLHPLYTHLRCAADAAGGEGEEDSTMAIKAALGAAKSMEDATHLVIDAILKRLSSVMSLPIEDIDSGRPIHHYGVDSLVAVEFRNWLNKGFSADIPVLDIMGNDSIAQLSEKIVKKSKLCKFSDE